ncbi:hypothetical protein TTHERM_00085060 (macronuclear) [Tetrahymena thermophila SB210]|uniref:VLRF1 domain-containing protein n=1 Tax=Tetrahymena thermophila (strain SB210) TaxID=312017 RepID=Q236U2_TETTS|nr:hypothetical protein TTHERM_00085060 [Tetrahymena thermophila SB210]EAR92408.1 hypothetical protein TTHERM_00085060 [Tetrahymena thermophila SB210]|eukprot:XP_001012653.1 hypothetical protein TTHERM_00085060 [Tetrahymena thermophila SB210]
MNFQAINLNFLFESDANCANLILSYLNKRELARFGQCCKYIHTQVIEFQKDQYNEEYNDWRQNKINRLKINNGTKKGNQNIKFIETDTNYIIKMRIFDIPLKYLVQKNWNFINESDEQYVKKIKSDKFIKEYNNLFFKNKQYNDILFINRSIIDPSLNYQESDFDEDEFEQTKYQELYQGQEFSSDNYDFSNMQSLLSRQKQIIQKMNKKEQVKQQQQIEESSYLNQLQTIKKITIILCHGGYFSIGIFNDKGNCIFHKSDHKYVVRKKAGQRQLNCDTQTGKKVKSIGSQIRRDQEKKHQEKVHNILNEHIDEIDKTDVVFLQAPGLNKQILIRDNEPLMKVQHKIRSLCLTAKKANYTEVERIYKAITKIYLVLNKEPKKQ